MFDAKQLLANEYFPSELPPCFTTVNLANEYLVATQTAVSFGRDCSIPLTFSGYKTENGRRRFALPNPFHYCRVVDFIVNHESEIKTILRKSRHSLTAPLDKPSSPGEPYAKRTHTVSETKAEIEQLYQNNLYEIRLDISSFFDSIYTHTIPWAIHGVSASKKNRSNALWGNELDMRMRAMNHNQTNGILIGNAISRIVSEIILCVVDEQIQKKFPDLVYCRYVDDYYIFTQDSAQIQAIIAEVRIALAKYQLSFNEAKLRISESPFQYGKVWVDSLRHYIYLSPEAYLSRLIAEYNQVKDISILRYGLRVLESCRFTDKVWSVIQSRLLNLWVSFPSLADRILPILWQNKTQLKKNPLRSAVLSVIDRSLALGLEQELIWAVWLLRVFDIKVSQNNVVRVLKSNNDLAIIIMLDIIAIKDMKKQSAIEKQLRELRTMLEDADKAESRTSQELMWSSHWLLAYEAERMKWLKFPGQPFEYACKNSFFKKLLEKHVKFYDETFSYDAPTTIVRGRYDLVSRAELHAAMNRLLKKIAARMKTIRDKHAEWTKEDEQMMEEYTRMLEDQEYAY